MKLITVKSAQKKKRASVVGSFERSGILPPTRLKTAPRIIPKDIITPKGNAYDIRVRDELLFRYGFNENPQKT